MFCSATCGGPQSQSKHVHIRCETGGTRISSLLWIALISRAAFVSDSLLLLLNCQGAKWTQKPFQVRMLPAGSEGNAARGERKSGDQQRAMSYRRMWVYVGAHMPNQQNYLHNVFGHQVECYDTLFLHEPSAAFRSAHPIAPWFKTIIRSIIIHQTTFMEQISYRQFDVFHHVWSNFTCHLLHMATTPWAWPSPADLHLQLQGIKIDAAITSCHGSTWAQVPNAGVKAVGSCVAVDAWSICRCAVPT